MLPEDHLPVSSGSEAIRYQRRTIQSAANGEKTTSVEAGKKTLLACLLEAESMPVFFVISVMRVFRVSSRIYCFFRIEDAILHNIFIACIYFFVIAPQRRLPGLLKSSFVSVTLQPLCLSAKHQGITFTIKIY